MLKSGTTSIRTFVGSNRRFLFARNWFRLNATEAASPGRFSSGRKFARWPVWRTSVHIFKFKFLLRDSIFHGMGPRSKAKRSLPERRMRMLGR